MEAYSKEFRRDVLAACTTAMVPYVFLPMPSHPLPISLQHPRSPIAIPQRHVDGDFARDSR